MAACTAEQFPLFQLQAEPQDAVVVTKEVVGALQENARSRSAYPAAKTQRSRPFAPWSILTP